MNTGALHESIATEPVRPVADARVVLLDAAAEAAWVAEIGFSSVIRPRADGWGDVDDWLEAWVATAVARSASAEWISRRLSIPAQAVLAISAPLLSEFETLLGRCGGGLAASEGLMDSPIGEQSAARLCARVLNWTGALPQNRTDRWGAFAEIAPAGEQPAFLLDGGRDLSAALAQGDLLACAGLSVGLRVEPGAWERFLSAEGWDRGATRWRTARTLGGALVQCKASVTIPTEEARRFVQCAAPETLQMLEHASILITEERASGADSLSAEARSAAEEFLFAVLRARPLTRGRFSLNVPLSFMFGTRAAEADLAAEDARLVVELDGYYHFRDAEGYRRDRRKDALLQEHGWFVLRFLAEDVMRDPGGVIAQIERTLARRDVSQTTNGHE